MIMRAPILMLAWEIWRRKYTYVCLSVGALPCYLLFYWAIHSHVHNEEMLGALSVPWVACSLFWMIATFIYTEVNSEKGWTGFPQRLFVLPVPTVVLVMLPMLLGMLSAALVCLAWLRLIFAPLGAGSPPGLAWWLAGFLAVDLACFQAIVWGLAGFRLTRIAVLAMVGCVLLVLEGCTYGFFVANPTRGAAYVFWKWCAALGYVGLALLAFLGVWRAVARQRRGGGRGRGRLKAWFKTLIERIVDALPARNKPFASPQAAQFWFEWRQGGVLLPVCVGAVLLLFIGPVSWLNRGDMNPGRTLLILSFILLTPIFLAFAIGKGFAKPDFWSMDLALKPFLAVRPLSAGEMVLAKMKVAALAAVVAWLLVLAAIPLWVILWVDTTTLRSISQAEAVEWVRVNYSLFSRCAILALLALLVMTLTWRGMVGGMWLGLSGKWRYLVGSAVLHGAVFVALLVALAHAEELSRTQHQVIARWIGWAAWALAVAVMVKLGAAVCFWDKVSQRHLGPRSVAACLLL